MNRTEVIIDGVTYRKTLTSWAAIIESVDHTGPSEVILVYARILYGSPTLKNPEVFIDDKEYKLITINWDGNYWPPESYPGVVLNLTVTAQDIPMGGYVGKVIYG